MITNAEENSGKIVTASQSDRSARAFVWSVWCVMMLVAIVFLIKFGRNVPLSEDWWLVPALTGNEPDLAGWLWAQNNEHRVPLAKLILLLLLKISKGDFRVGMLFNIVLLGALAIAMIYVIRYVRGGRTNFADAFFPVALLHLGNWENLFWSWQLVFILPMVLTCLTLMVLVVRRTRGTPYTEIVAGISLMLLPFCGANGLLFVPPLALWFAYYAFRRWPDASSPRANQWATGLLLGSVAFALCLTALYFVGYERPSWTPPNPGLSASLKATVKFLALGFGPAARSSWVLSVIAVLALLLPTLGLLIRRVLGHSGPDRDRALGILVFFGSMAAFAFAIGWGRAGVITLYGGWPTRYVLIAMPAFITAYFVWELYGSPRLRSTVQSTLFAGLVLLIPFNTIHGFWWYNGTMEGDELLMQDLAVGTPLSTIAERHKDILYPHISPYRLEDMMQMLRNDHIGPFARGQENISHFGGTFPNRASTQLHPPVSQEFHYNTSDAGEVFLVWGVNGWNVVPEHMRPNGTEVNKVMHTPMTREGHTFTAKVQVPSDTTIDYGFLITKGLNGTDIIKPIWDGDPKYRVVSSNHSVVKVNALRDMGPDHTPVITNDTPLLTLDIFYHIPQAGEVFMVWGIDDWQAVPEKLRPPGTITKDGLMRTPMVKEKDIFLTKVQLPTGAKLNYGFLITERQSIFHMIAPAWDGGDDYQRIISEDGILEVKSALTLPDELSDVFDNGLYFLAGISVFLTTWLLFFFFIGLLSEEKRELFA